MTAFPSGPSQWPGIGPGIGTAAAAPGLLSSVVTHQFRQVDVFTNTPYLGNPVAVVLGADGLSTEQMQLFARWTKLSETTFVLAPRASGADYLVRIFTPNREPPFAGHPTLGAATPGWEQADGPAPGRRRAGTPGRAGQGPADSPGRGRPGVRGPAAGASGPVEDPVAERVARALNIPRDDIVDIAWADNGPGWIAVLLASAEAARPSGRARYMDIGVAAHPDGSPEAPSRCARSARGSPRSRTRSRAAERLARAVAAGRRAGHLPVRGQPGHRHGPPRPGARACDGTARSGWAAAWSPA